MTINIPTKDAKEIASVLSRLIKSDRMLDDRTIKPTYNEVMALVALQFGLSEQLQQTAPTR